MMEQLEEAAKLTQPIPETVQFYHDMDNGITYAVDVLFNKEDLLETIHCFNNPIGMLIGESYVHPNDNYCKKTGRELAGRRTKPEKTYLYFTRNVEVDKIYLTFGTKTCTLEFRVNKNSEKPHLIKVTPV